MMEEFTRKEVLEVLRYGQEQIDKLNVAINESFMMLRKELNGKEMMDLIDSVSIRSAGRYGEIYARHLGNRDMVDIIEKINRLTQESISTRYTEVMALRRKIERIHTVQIAYRSLDYDIQLLLDLVYNADYYSEGLEIAGERFKYSSRTARRKATEALDHVVDEANRLLKEPTKPLVIDHSFMKQIYIPFVAFPSSENAVQEKVI